MTSLKLAISIAVGCIVLSEAVDAEEPRIVEKDGVQYRETRRVVKQPVVETQWEPREETYYRPRVSSQYRDTYRQVCSPVTEYHWMSRMHGRWNPFLTPYYTHHLVPVTRWEQRPEVVQLPVASTEWVAETRTVHVPVTRQRLAEREIIERVAVASSSAPPRTVTYYPSSDAPRVASAPPTTLPVGGVQLPSDPPRYPTGWRPSTR